MLTNELNELIDRARQAGLDIRPVRLSYPQQDSKKIVITRTVLNSEDLVITVWPSGLLNIGDSNKPVTIENAARYLRLYPTPVKEQ